MVQIKLSAPSARRYVVCLMLLLSLMSVFSYPQAFQSRLQGVLERLSQTSRFSVRQLDEFGQSRGASLIDGRVQVVVEVNAAAMIANVQTALSALGAVHVSSFETLLEAQVPLAGLTSLAEVNGVGYVRLPYVARPASVYSEGVSLIGASEYQRAGLQGAGVKVAIIDLGFDGLARAFVSGDIPANVVQLDFTNSGIGGIAHGTAVAEIVHDVAPGAQLYLMKVANEVQLGQAVEEALRQGVRIINHSVVWYNTEFGDGTGGVSQIAAQAVNRGVVWVNSAGNTALLHWKGAFRDQDDDSWAEFDFTGGETLSLQAEAGQLIEVFLNWDAWPQTAVDYDLFLTFDANGNGEVDAGEIFASSVDPQRGLDPPLEQASIFAAATGRYLISVLYKGAQTPPPLEIFSAQHTLQTPVRQGSVLAPATAANVLAIGAIEQSLWGLGRIQPFSAQGPTSDGQIKPDLVAPDEVSNFTASQFPKQFGVQNRFSGTSAAAPHVAGALALLMGETPGMTGNQAFLEVTRNALNLPPFRPNNFNGFGKLHLSLTPTQELDLTFSELTVSAQTVEAKETITVSLKVHNPHPRAVSVTVPFLVNDQTVAVQEVVLAPGQTQVISFNWEFTSLGSFAVRAGDLPSMIVRVVPALVVFKAALSPQTNHVLKLTVDGLGIERVLLQIFDLSAQRVIRRESAALPLTVPFFNEFGIPLANGVYLYTVTVFGATNSKHFPVKKLLILF